MPRDYKSRAQPRQGRKPVAGWVWLLAGLLLGAFGTGLLWLQSTAVQPGGGWVGARPDRPPKGEQTAAPAPAAATPARPKPRFDFYTLLPEMEVVVPDDELDQAREPGATAPDRGAAADQPYLIQIGSFRRAADADTLKAQLALLGIESRVVEARINERELRYRVRSGPYIGRAKLDTARRQLAAHGYKAMVIRSR